MDIFWKDYQGSDPTLWSHEWNKHGTCISTLDTKCYASYVPQEEVVDFFNKTVELFKKRPTWTTLARSAIVPSKSKTYTREQIQNALRRVHGAGVTLGCHNGALDEVWYHYEVRGSVQTGQWVAAEPDASKSSCPSTGIKYLPKDPATIPTSTEKKISTTATQTVEPTSTSTTAPFTGAGFLQVHMNGTPKGCLISDGTWYTSGTCATFHAEDDPSEAAEDEEEEKGPKDRVFTLTSSKGPCGFISGALACGRNVGKQDIFSVGEGGFLALKKNTTFFAESVPGHAHRAKVFSEQGERELKLQVEWQSK